MKYKSKGPVNLDMLFSEYRGELAYEAEGVRAGAIVSPVCDTCGVDHAGCVDDDDGWGCDCGCHSLPSFWVKEIRSDERVFLVVACNSKFQDEEVSFEDFHRRYQVTGHNWSRHAI